MGNAEAACKKIRVYSVKSPLYFLQDLPGHEHLGGEEVCFDFLGSVERVIFVYVRLMFLIIQQ